MSGDGQGRLSALEYAGLVARVQETVAGAVSPGASILVVSKGDAGLLEMPGLKAAHFPQDENGGYPGHHPRDGAAAWAQLEKLRWRGAEYLVLPDTGRWWLDFYADFAGHLASECELVADVADACMVWRLPRWERKAAEGPPPGRPQASTDQLRDYLQTLISTESGIAVLETVDDFAARLAPLSTMRFHVAGAEVAVLPGLARLARAGAEYLVVPRSEDEWLARHPTVLLEIEDSCPKLADQRHLCRVYGLAELSEEEP
jgi:hypothetical protein